MAEIELKPCPFCGDNQQLNYVELSNGLHYIECARCGAAPHRLGAWNRETAVKYWNSVNRWIPCSERLPEIKEFNISDTVLCYCDSGALAIARLESNGFGQVGFNCEKDDDYHHSAGKVLYWMPIPEIPEPPEKE